GIVIRNALFRVPAKADHSTVPWVTYTDPELANVGLTEAQARAQHDHVRVVRWPFAENDRAQAERRTEGLVKVVTGKGGRILGAGIAGPHAGELIQPWILAMATKQKIGAMTGIIAPYPTLGEVNKRAAGAYYTQSLFSPRTQKLVRWLAKLG
ncbi:MAG TPA: dihydrolipoamide dehydrogenase, partial [Alphaproteobacteria bacterium]|nr:dihydrolipoamide dehydrogenase [Alphaproteobacteria bacterium]